MRLTLTYDGPLPASGNHDGNAHKPDPKLAIKWAIRDQLEPQLVAVYESHPAVSSQGGEFSLTVAARAVRQPIKRGFFEFGALVRPEMDLICDLKIKMLVNHAPGSVITKTGDLDNRLKTLIDALRVPKEEECKNRPPWEGLYACLLEDDSLVVGINISSERWYGGGGKAANEAHVEIEAQIRTGKPNQYSKTFGID